MLRVPSSRIAVVVGCGTALVALALLAPTPARAQSKTTAALYGQVVDESGGALPGATVEVSSPAQIGGARSTTSDARGEYRFAQVAPGTYSVDAKLDGFQPVRIEGVVLPVGATISVRVELKIAAIAETLVVTSEAVALDTSSSGTVTNLDSQYLDNLPTARFQPEVLNYAPGINQSVAFGSAESGLAYQLDGIDTSDPEGGTAWSFVNYNIVDEVQLVGLGAPAEYGSFSGVVFNSITKSGGNDTKGLVESLYTGGSLSGDVSDSALAALNPQLEKETDSTFQIGGPIARDRLWYFLNGQYYKLEESSGGPLRTEESPRLFGKLTWQANEKNQVDSWLEWDRYDITGRGGDGVTPLEATVTEDAPEYVWNLSWRSQLSENTIFNLSYGGYDGYYYLDPQNGYGISGHLDALTGTYNTNSTYYYLADRARNQVNASISHFSDDFLKGTHDFKFGMEIERSTIRSRYGYTNGAWFYDNYAWGYIDPGTYDPNTYEYQYADYVTYGYYGYSYDLHGTIERGSLFAQDAWKIAPNLTLNLGVRGELDRGKVPGQGKVLQNHAIAPRIGIAWDPQGDGKTVLKAHYGRYYEKFVATEFYYAAPGAYSPLEIRILYPSGFVESLGQARPGGIVLDRDLDQPYLDQYIVGIDREIAGGMTLSGTLIYRKKQDFIETVSRDGVFVPVTGTVAETGKTVTLYDYLNPETDTLVYRNVPALERKYEGAMLTLSRRLRDNWQMLLSYVYSRTTGNMDNTIGFNSAYGGDNPGRFLDTPNSLVNADGKLTYDQTQQLKLQGTYMVPKLGLSFSGNYTYYTGNTYTLLSRCLVVDGDCYDFNQGAVRFFGEKRGSRRLDPASQLDLRAEWTHGLARESEIGLFLDVFNVLNDARATEIEDRTGASFETPLSVNRPRTYRIGANFRW